MAKIEDIVEGKTLGEKLGLIHPSTFQSAREIYETKDENFYPSLRSYTTSDLAVYAIVGGEPVLYLLGRNGNPLAYEKLWKDFYGQLKKDLLCIPSGKSLQHILNAIHDKKCISMGFNDISEDGFYSRINIYSVIYPSGLIPESFHADPHFERSLDLNSDERNLIKQLFGIDFNSANLPSTGYLGSLRLPATIEVLSSIYVKNILKGRENEIIVTVGDLSAGTLSFCSTLKNEIGCGVSKDIGGVRKIISEKGDKNA